MLGGRQTEILAVVMMAVLGRAQEAGGAPTDAEAAVKAIQDLDIAAKSAEQKMRGRCADLKSGVDLAAATIALTAAYIHIARMERAKELNVSAEDLAPVALQAAVDLRHAFLCNPAAIENLETATGILDSIRAKLPDAAVRARENVDKELAEVNALKATHRGPGSAANIVPTITPAPGPSTTGPSTTAAPAPGPTVATIALDQGEVDLSTPRSQTYLERLALRLEVGFGAAQLDPNRTSRHRGAYFRAQLLARFIPGEQKQIHLLFGPYYTILGARDPAGTDSSASEVTVGNANMHGFGAHFELQWQPRRTAPWLSFHPFLDIGIEHIKVFDSQLGSSGFQGGGGLLLCVFHSSICPNFRLMSLPALNSRPPTVQFGVAFDLLRWFDLGLSRTRQDKQVTGRSGSP